MMKNENTTSNISMEEARAHIFEQIEVLNGLVAAQSAASHHFDDSKACLKHIREYARRGTHIPAVRACDRIMDTPDNIVAASARAMGHAITYGGGWFSRAVTFISIGTGSTTEELLARAYAAKEAARKTTREAGSKIAQEIDFLRKAEKAIIEGQANVTTGRTFRRYRHSDEFMAAAKCDDIEYGRDHTWYEQFNAWPFIRNGNIRARAERTADGTRVVSTM